MGIMVMPVNFSVAAGASQQYMAMAMYADNTTEDITDNVAWTTSNAAVAAVSTAAGSQGMVTGVTAGAATVSATPDGGSGAAMVNVTAPAPFVVDEVRVAQKNHMIRQIIVDFSGAIDTAAAENPGSYRLVTQGRNGSFAAKNSVTLKPKSAVLGSGGNEVTLS